MDTVQALRGKADQEGKLTSTSQQNVVKTTDEGHPVIAIEPASPGRGRVCLPDYDPAWIWGPAPIYYPYPYWYYHPPRPVGAWCWWGPRIGEVGIVFRAGAVGVVGVGTRIGAAMPSL